MAMKLEALKKVFGSEEILEDEAIPRKNKKRGKVYQMPQEDMMPGYARSYRVANIDGEIIERGNVETEPGDEFLALARFFASKYPDFRDELVEIVKETGKEEDIRKTEYTRVYISTEEDPEDLEGLSCVLDEKLQDESSVFVTMKPGEAEIAFPEGYRPWTAEIDADGIPTVIVSAEENTKFSKLYAKKVAERKKAKQEEIAATAAAEAEEKAEDSEEKPEKGKKGNNN